VASYDALINLRVKGLNDLNKIDSAVNGITRGAKDTTKAVKDSNRALMTQGLRLRGLAKSQNTLIEKMHKRGGKGGGFLLPDSKALNASARGIKRYYSDQQTHARHVNKVQEATLNVEKRRVKLNRDLANHNRVSARVGKNIRAAKAAAHREEIRTLQQIINLRTLADRAGRIGGRLGALDAPAELNTRGPGGRMLALPSAEMRAGAPGAFQNAPGFRGTRQAPTAKGRGSGALQSALISGAFPLLFGQGPLGGAAGFAGGFLGTKMGGQMGGFAGGLVATAALQSIQQTIGAVSQLGQALNPLTADMSALTKAAGLMGTVDANRLALIQEVQGKQAALNAALREMTSVIGEKGVQALQKFGEQTTALTNAWSKFMTSVFASIAEALNKSGLTDKLTNLLNNLSGANSGLAFAGSSNASAALQGRAGQLNSLNTQIAGMQSNLGAGGGIKAGDERKAAIARLGEKEYNTELKKLDALVQQKRVLEEIIAEKANIEQIEHNALETQKIINEAAFGAMEKENEVAKDTVQVGAARAELNERIRKAQDEYLKILQKVDPTIEKISSEEADRVKSAVELNDQLKRTAELSQQLRDTFVEGLASGIEGLITGTKTLKESLAGILRDFGSILLRTGLQNMMPGFGSFFGKGIGSAEGNYLANGIRPFASGGMVTRPTMGLVGEAGEDEYVIPASKMAQSMQRYSAGARGQSVIPGTGASSSGGASGSSTTVNYSGPILNFNSEEFVPKSAVGQIINSAASKGAAAGESRTMSTLRNSRSARARIGM
jgi:hypothetical protein